MAFYVYNSTREAVQTIGPNDKLRATGVGAFYAYDATHEAVQPINGVALGASATLTDEVMREMLGARRPLLVAGNWAVRVTDTAWRPSSDRTSELTLVPITDQDVARVKVGAGGHEVPMVGVLARRTNSLVANENAFVGTPYTYETELALVALGDERAVPVPVFLTLARLRDADDRDGGNAPLARAAAALGGTLVYVISIEGSPGRQLPPIELALSRMPRSTGPRPVAPGTPPPPPTPDVVNLRRAAAARGTGGFSQKGVLGTISTPAIALGVGALALCGVVVAAAAIGGSK